jgi:lipopolysaccharide export system ATP-binding protein
MPTMSSPPDSASPPPSPAVSDLFEAQGLVKTYGNRTVVRGASFRVESGEVVGLLGPNGAGKTTSFLMSLGQVRPDQGEIRLLGENVTDLPTYRRARRGLSYLAQEPSIFRRLTVEQNVMAVLEVQNFDRGERKRRCAELLDAMDIRHLGRNRAETLSGGERRRLEIARALGTDPKLILLDEPFAGVDPIAVEEIQRVVRGLTERGIGILLTDHNVRETLSITDRAYIIYEGRILKHGPAEDLISDPAVRRIYLGQTFDMPELATRSRKARPEPRPAAAPAAPRGGLVGKTREVFETERKRPRKRKRKSSED